MSIDFLFDLERGIDTGREVFACPGQGRNQWIFGKSVDELRKQAQRAADTRKMSVTIVRILNKNETIPGQMFLVPTQIGEAGPRGEPVVSWATVETKEAAEMMKDVRKGPPPFFGMEIQETIEPASTA